MYICGCVCIYIYEMFFYNCKLENSKWKLKFGSMLVFCLLFMAWKNTTQLPKHLCISHMSTWGVQSSKKKKNQLFHVQYLFNGLTTGNWKKLPNQKNWKKKAKSNTTPRYLNLCIWTSWANELSNFSCSEVFLY